MSFQKNFHTDDTIVFDVSLHSFKAGIAGEIAPRCILNYQKHIYNVASLEDNIGCYEIMQNNAKIPSREDYREDCYMCDSLRYIPSSIAAMISYGCSSGLVIDCGHNDCTVTPIFEGRQLCNLVEIIPIGGKDTDFDNNYIEALKTKFSLVKLENSIDVNETMISFDYKDNTFQVPSRIFSDIYRSIFVEGWEDMNISKLICPCDTRKTLMENILLSGGTCSASGFSSALEQTLREALRTQNMDHLLNFIKIKDTNFSLVGNSWLGGSILCKMKAIK
ncbi:actin-like ATPase domain-containing protein [Rozella allomycis CSF55]|uniref:Actin-like ATPase domain-containing protein n=1 Tax=Rozella allomycis (strain CSF55) TaxID=988480 RepID=A0A075AQS2_ROZAC|nr:hypothetical protein O9G_002307 [Rozella allomycis CSF55]RKP20249.1 actin-like ATPase domain-containing protein [Rozella allomycis CSF55]|eukprot:EPZ32530.1 hypothetical protein O9G_002307 [Rozella allomycis CSF55]